MREGVSAELVTGRCGGNGESRGLSRAPAESARQGAPANAVFRRPQPQCGANLATDQESSPRPEVSPRSRLAPAVVHRPADQPCIRNVADHSRPAWNNATHGCSSAFNPSGVVHLERIPPQGGAVEGGFGAVPPVAAGGGMQQRDDRRPLRCGVGQFLLVTALHLVVNDRMPGGVAQRGGDEVLPCPAAETQFLDQIHSGSRTGHPKDSRDGRREQRVCLCTLSLSLYSRQNGSAV